MNKRLLNTLSLYRPVVNSEAVEGATPIDADDVVPILARLVRSHRRNDLFQGLDPFCEGFQNSQGQTRKDMLAELYACGEERTGVRDRQERTGGKDTQSGAVRMRDWVHRNARFFVTCVHEAVRSNKQLSNRRICRPRNCREVRTGSLFALAQEAKKDKATQPGDWGSRCKKSVPIFLDRSRKLLSDEQLERFKNTLTIPHRGEDRPEAPPAPGDSP